jgi:ankyrin repeat protein
MKKILSSIICTAIIVLLSSCSTPPPPDTIFNLSSDDPYRQGQNLVEAIAHGSNSAAYRLMERGAPLNYQDKKDEWTPLIYAIYHYNWRMAKVLIRAGANVNLADSANRTPLMWAALRNSGITATILVEHGADINAVDISGRTALQYAIIYTNYTLAAYLADAGRKPPAQRLKKEQFDRLRHKREKARAEAENLKLYGTTKEREIIVNMQKKDANINVKEAKKVEEIKPKKKILPVKTEAVKAAPKKESKPVTISEILNTKPAKASPKKEVKPIEKAKEEPKEYVKPLRLIKPVLIKTKPKTITVKVAPQNPLAPRNPYLPPQNGGPQ